MFLQETHSIKNSEKVWKAEYGNANVYFDHGESNARGVATIISNDLQYQLKSSWTSNEGRILILQIEIETISYLFMNVYAPNLDRPEFYKRLFEKILEFETDHVILAGDFNLYLDVEKDKRGGKLDFTSKSADFVNLFMEENEYLDVWRELNPDRFCFTWKNRSKKLYSSLDYILVPLATMQKVDSCEILAGIKSDHKFVEIVLHFSNSIRGPGYWKFNNSLLLDKTYVDMINEVIQRIETEAEIGNLDPTTTWGTLKTEVIEKTIIYSKEKAKKHRTLYAKLQKDLAGLEKRLSMINLNSFHAVRFIEEINVKIDAV